jgi:hypothetical protein
MLITGTGSVNVTNIGDEDWSVDVITRVLSALLVQW